ncbi:hypothetical protein DPX16_2239 [Anabarilius grahami]|uniref:Uncharacterized protein n=1 Tax=Anabarilius grahami TaxID=495550 RepID=A0A3N0YRR4_ANAGA|nr:hypothetical protein DPX16_2239 [Anabarilius grahami]
MSSNASDTTGQFKDSASASSSSGLKPQKDTESQWFDTCPNFDNEVVIASLSDTPQKPAAKKTKRAESSGTGNEDVLAAIRDLALKHDKTFQKISAIENTTEATSKQIKSLTATLQQLILDVGVHKEALDHLESEVRTLREENKTLRASVQECRRYGWRWFLKLHGVAEKDNEDVRNVALNVLEKIAPGVGDGLQDSVDVVHRLGPKRADGKARSIIILFSQRRIRDIIWGAAKGCKFLMDNKLRLSEPLSPEDRAARDKLWPLVKKAREEGKKATFRNSFALIDGKQFFYSDVM